MACHPRAARSAFARIGLELFAEPKTGMLLWARFPHVDDATTLTEDATRHGIMLPRHRLPPPPWMRFNVTTCDDARLIGWLEQAAARQEVEGALRAAE